MYICTIVEVCVEPPDHDHGPGNGHMPHPAQVCLDLEQLELFPGGESCPEDRLRVRKLLLKGLAESSKAKHVGQQSVPEHSLRYFLGGTHHENCECCPI